MSGGLHHVTAITRKIQENVDFYAGFLGLRLVKRTTGFEDVAQLHLLYGDAVASPGSLITFLAWEDGSAGRVGHGAPSEISFAIAPEALGFWLTRAIRHNLRFEGPLQEFGDSVLRLNDPDGIAVKLVAVAGGQAASPWASADIGPDDAITGLFGVTLLSEKPSETADFLTRYMGFSHGSRSGPVERLVSESGTVVDIRDASGFWTAAPGTGTIDHVAFRAADLDAVNAVETALRRDLSAETNTHDRKYFHSLYVREPGGSLIELASDGPGFTLDEPLQQLGTQLFIPPHFAGDHDDLEVVLPQFALPGEPRLVERKLDFIHRIHQPRQADGSTLVLLHGSGGNETSLLAFARHVAPQAILIGVRGRATEEGVPRFFRRFGVMRFDQADIRAEAEALNAFIGDIVPAYGVDPQALAFIGYSNGANMLAALMRLHPGSVRRAALLRTVDVLEEQTEANLAGTDILSISGAADLYAPYARGLEDRLAAAGAGLVARQVEGDHMIGAADEAIVRDWLKGG